MSDVPEALVQRAATVSADFFGESDSMLWDDSMRAVLAALHTEGRVYWAEELALEPSEEEVEAVARRDYDIETGSDYYDSWEDMREGFINHARELLKVSAVYRLRRDK